MGKAAKIKFVKPRVGLQSMDMKGNRWETIAVAQDGKTVRQRNTATGGEFDFPAALLGFYLCW